MFQTRTFLLKYGEIFLKGKNRYVFEDILVDQVRRAVAKCDGEFKVHKSLSRIYVEALSDFDGAFGNRPAAAADGPGRKREGQKFDR